MGLKDKDQLLKYLQSLNLMAIATKGNNLWIASVYYVIDYQFNLYFLSEPTTIHCEDIKKNSEVTCSIADSHQKVTDKKIGVQLFGTAEQVNNLEKMKWMLVMWNKINPGFENVINIKNIQKRVIKSKIYKVQPKTIKFFNEKLYGPEGFKIFNF